MIFVAVLYSLLIKLFNTALPSNYMKYFCLQRRFKCSTTIDVDMLNIFGVRIIMKYRQDFVKVVL